MSRNRAGFDRGESEPIGIDRYLLRFDDPTEERRFRAEYDARAARFARLAISAGAPGYVLMAVILDDAGARTVAMVMIGVIAGWVALSWTPLFERWFNQVTVAAVAVLTGLSMVMLYELPPASAVIIAIAFLTLNFMWIFVFLRPRFPWALAIGVGYFALVVVGCASIWDRFGAGAAPEGMVDLLGGRSGGMLLIALYAGFLLVLTASVAYRLERGERVDFLLRRELAVAHDRSERLLTNVLPVPVAERLKEGENPIADDLREVSVVFADIVGFTQLSASMDPSELLRLLDDVFSRFDDLAAAHGLEKIKTIGDAYMAVAGAPHPMDDHAAAAAAMALDMVRVVESIRLADGGRLGIRIGIGSGPAVAGVIGTSKFIYDLWGDTVNTASRMESHGLPGRVHISDETHRLLGGQFAVEDRGLVDVKGKGRLQTWLLAPSDG